MKRRSTLPCLAGVLAIACPAPAGAARHDRVERSVIRQINAIRHANGMGGVRPWRALRHAAENHSRDMAAANFFDHASSDGTPFDARVRRYVGARPMGETLAALSGGHKAVRVVQMWMNSPPHRAVLLQRTFNRIGLARHRSGFGTVFTADFARRR